MERIIMGTTPTFEYTFKTVDVSNITTAVLTIKQGGEVAIEKTLSDATPTETNSKLGSTGTGSTRQSTSAYGIYVNSASVSGSTMTLAFYKRYNSNSTGTLNGTYTARVYGLKLYDLIGG